MFGFKRKITVKVCKMGDDLVYRRKIFGLFWKNWKPLGNELATIEEKILKATRDLRKQFELLKEMEDWHKAWRKKLEGHYESDPFSLETKDSLSQQRFMQRADKQELRKWFTTWMLDGKAPSIRQKLGVTDEPRNDSSGSSVFLPEELENISLGIEDFNSPAGVDSVIIDRKPKNNNQNNQKRNKDSNNQNNQNNNQN